MLYVAVYNQLVHWHHDTQGCCRLVASCACHRPDTSKHYKSCLVNTLSNDCHPLLVTTETRPSHIASYSTLHKYDTSHKQPSEKHGAKSNKSDNETMPKKEVEIDDSRSLSSHKKDADTSGKSELSDDGDTVTEVKTGVFARFKLAYKEYGKVLIGVHVVTSCVWFGGFYYTAVT